MTAKQISRLNVLANINLIGFPVITIVLLGVVCFQANAWGWFTFGATLIFPISFTILALFTKRNMHNINRKHVQGMFFYTIGISLFPCMAVNYQYEIMALALMIVLLIVGYVGMKHSTKPYIKLEIINYIALFYLFVITTLTISLF